MDELTSKPKIVVISRSGKILYSREVGSTPVSIAQFIKANADLHRKFRREIFRDQLRKSARRNRTQVCRPSRALPASLRQAPRNRCNRARSARPQATTARVGDSPGPSSGDPDPDLQLKNKTGNCRGRTA